MKIGCSTYSFWHFKGEKKPLKEYIKKIYLHGFEGVEVLANHVESFSKDYLLDIKRYAFSLGLDIYALDIHNNFINPSKDEREKEINHVKDWLKVAYRLGAKAIRINSGRWKTIENFDELMKHKGIEPPIPGYTSEDAFKWVIGSLKELVPVAEDYGVILALENHWGLTRNADNVIKILKEVNSEWVKALVDIGNFIEKPYEQIEKLAQYAIMVHAKTYMGGGEWYALDLDYSKIFDILRRHCFKGWISLEYEGKEDYDFGVKLSKELIMSYIL